MLNCVKTAVDVYQGFISPTRCHHLLASPVSLASALLFSSSTRTGRLLTRPSATMCTAALPTRLWVIVSVLLSLGGAFSTDISGCRLIMLTGIRGCCACLIVEAKNVESFTTDTSGRDHAAPGTAALFMSNAEYNPRVHVTGCRTTLGAKVLCLPNKCLRSPI